jgi:hypothetical protein
MLEDGCIVQNRVPKSTGGRDGVEDFLCKEYNSVLPDPAEYLRQVRQDEITAGPCDEGWRRYLGKMMLLDVVVLGWVEQFTSRQNNNFRDWLQRLPMSTQGPGRARAGCCLARMASAPSEAGASPASATSTPRKFANTQKIFPQSNFTSKNCTNVICNVRDPFRLPFS